MPARRAVRTDQPAFRPSERPPNIHSSVKRRKPKGSDARKGDKLTWRCYDAGNWYVIGVRGAEEYVVSTHPDKIDADRARTSYLNGQLEYDDLRVEKHGSRGLVSKS